MKSDAEAAESLSQYVKFWMRERGMSYPNDVVEAAARKGAQISNTKVNTIILAQYANHQMRVLEALALALVRPLGEVFQAALGYFPPIAEMSEFKESDAANLWNLMRHLSAKERRPYERYLQMLANEIHRTANKDNE